MDISARLRDAAGALALSLCLASAFQIAAVPPARGAEEPLPPRGFTPLQRLERARLKAAHEDVERLRQGRKVLPPIAGLTDYRAILHAHAEDSAHTGGTRSEMLSDAKRAGVNAILLTDHHRPPRDFIDGSWRGLREGVLFIPGSEERGFLLFPMASIMNRMKEPTADFVRTVTSGGGLIFLSHIEERRDHSMAGLTGMEIYNRHFDAKQDRPGLLALVLKLTSPESLAELEDLLRLYPDELFAFQVQYPSDYMAKWDAETKTRRLTGVAANDCHHNQVMLVKMVDEQTVRVGTIVDKDEDMRKVTALLRPGIRAMTHGRRPGDVLARIDLDPYHRSFRDASTHVLARALAEPALREALSAGHAYVSHDWICDPTGFRYELVRPTDPGEDRESRNRSGSSSLMGDEVAFSPGATLIAQFPVPCRIRLLKDGTVVADRNSDRIEYPAATPGVYRVEGWLKVGGEDRGWIYSNPIYVRSDRRG